MSKFQPDDVDCPAMMCRHECCTGCVPSLVQMFIVFPVSTPFGLGGVGLGALTPVFVLIFNTIGWGIPAYAWFRLAGEHAGRRTCNTNLTQ